MSIDKIVAEVEELKKELAEVEALKAEIAKLEAHAQSIADDNAAVNEKAQKFHAEVSRLADENDVMARKLAAIKNLVEN